MKSFRIFLLLMSLASSCTGKIQQKKGGSEDANKMLDFSGNSASFSDFDLSSMFSLIDGGDENEDSSENGFEGVNFDDWENYDETFNDQESNESENEESIHSDDYSSNYSEYDQEFNAGWGYGSNQESSSNPEIYQPGLNEESFQSQKTYDNEESFNEHNYVYNESFSQQKTYGFNEDSLVNLDNSGSNEGSLASDIYGYNDFENFHEDSYYHQNPYFEPDVDSTTMSPSLYPEEAIYGEPVQENWGFLEKLEMLQVNLPAHIFEEVRLMFENLAIEKEMMVSEMEKDKEELEAGLQQQIKDLEAKMVKEKEEWEREQKRKDEDREKKEKEKKEREERRKQEEEEARRKKEEEESMLRNYMAPQSFHDVGHGWELDQNGFVQQPSTLEHHLGYPPPHHETYQPEFGYFSNVLQPEFDVLQPGFQHHPPGLETYLPGLEQYSPGLEPFQLGFEAMQPGFEAMQPGFEAMQPGFEAMQPGFEAMQPVLRHYSLGPGVNPFGFDELGLDSMQPKLEINPPDLNPLSADVIKKMEIEREIRKLSREREKRKSKLKEKKSAAKKEKTRSSKVRNSKHANDTSNRRRVRKSKHKTSISKTDGVKQTNNIRDDSFRGIRTERPVNQPFLENSSSHNELLAGDADNFLNPEYIRGSNPYRQPPQIKNIANELHMLNANGMTQAQANPMNSNDPYYDVYDVTFNRHTPKKKRRIRTGVGSTGADGLQADLESAPDNAIQYEEEIISPIDEYYGAYKETFVTAATKRKNRLLQLQEAMNAGYVGMDKKRNVTNGDGDVVNAPESRMLGDDNGYYDDGGGARFPHFEDFSESDKSDDYEDELGSGDIMDIGFEGDFNDHGELLKNPNIDEGSFPEKSLDGEEIYGEQVDGGNFGKEETYEDRNYMFEGVHGEGSYGEEGVFGSEEIFEGSYEGENWNSEDEGGIVGGEDFKGYREITVQEGPEVSGYGQSLPEGPDYVTEYGPSPPEVPGYGSSSPYVPGYGSSSPDLPGYGSSSPDVPGYGSGRPELPRYESGKSEAPEYESGRPGYKSDRTGAPGYESGRPGAPDYEAGRPGAIGYESGRHGAHGYESGRPEATGFKSSGPEPPRYESGRPGAPGYESNRPEASEYESLSPEYTPAYRGRSGPERHRNRYPRDRDSQGRPKGQLKRTRFSKSRRPDPLVSNRHHNLRPKYDRKYNGRRPNKARPNERRPYDRKQYDRRPNDGRLYGRLYGRRSHEERPNEKRPDEGRPYKERERPYEERERPYEERERPYEERERPYEEIERPYKERPYGERVYKEAPLEDAWDERFNFDGKEDLEDQEYRQKKSYEEHHDRQTLYNKFDQRRRNDDYDRSNIRRRNDYKRPKIRRPLNHKRPNTRRPNDYERSNTRRPNDDFESPNTRRPNNDYGRPYTMKPNTDYGRPKTRKPFDNERPDERPDDELDDYEEFGDAFGFDQDFSGEENKEVIVPSKPAKNRPPIRKRKNPRRSKPLSDEPKPPRTNLRSSRRKIRPKSINLRNKQKLSARKRLKSFEKYNRFDKFALDEDKVSEVSTKSKKVKKKRGEVSGKRRKVFHNKERGKKKRPYSRKSKISNQRLDRFKGKGRTRNPRVNRKKNHRSRSGRSSNGRDYGHQIPVEMIDYKISEL